MSENAAGPTSQPLDIEALPKLKTTELEMLVRQLPSGREREQVLEVLVAKYREMYSELARQATESFIDKLGEKALDAVRNEAQKVADAAEKALASIKDLWRLRRTKQGKPANDESNEGGTPD